MSSQGRVFAGTCGEQEIWSRLLITGFLTSKYLTLLHAVLPRCTRLSVCVYLFLFIYFCQVYTDAGKNESIFDSLTTQSTINHVSALLASKKESRKSKSKTSICITEAMNVRKWKVQTSNTLSFNDRAD